MNCDNCQHIRKGDKVMVMHPDLMFLGRVGEIVKPSVNFSTHLVRITSQDGFVNHIPYPELFLVRVAANEV